jgi:uncharacterized protein (DUF362 family)/Pyruvate/2-oxoacid:ferredoxin oxidoreductase delta subunit
LATKVSITRCPDYNHLTIEQSIHQCLAPLGGIQAFVKPGQKVLIKPNALLGKTPDHAVTTHPALIAAVIREVKKAGGIALVGDSPGNAHSNVQQTMELTGFKQAAKEAGGILIYFQQQGVVEVKSPSGNRRLPVLMIAKPALEADVIINPGFNKTSFHAINPRSRDFAESIVDVFQITKPTLNIMDAVVGMEGPGPSNGAPRRFGALLASTDAVALDSVCSYLIGYKPEEIFTTAVAAQRKLGEMDLARIEVIGPRLDDIRQADWQKSFNVQGFINWLPDFIFNLAAPIVKQLSIYPAIDQAKCTRCLACFQSCPVKTIIHDPAAQVVWIDQKRCISCFCCHELCEYNAVKLERSWLVRLLRLG